MDPTLMVRVEEMRAFRNVEKFAFDELADLLLEFADRWPGTWGAHARPEIGIASRREGAPSRGLRVAFVPSL